MTYEAAIHSWQYTKMCDILLINNMITFKICDMPNKNSLSCKKGRGQAKQNVGKNKS